MSTPYILTFSDPTNLNTITVLPASVGPGINIDDTSLTLVGAGYTNYGQPTAQNFLKLLENFSGPNQPSHAIKGQLWYDTSNPERKVLRVNNGEVSNGRWPSANGIYQQAVDPVTRYTTNIVDGDIWVDTANNQLKIRSINEWTVVGPSVQQGVTKSGSEIATIESTTGAFYPVILNWVNGKVVEIIAYNAFTPRTVIDGFATIKIGTNLTTRVAAKYNGLAEKASALETTAGLLIKASDVLKNNVTSQIHTGTLYIESAAGLYIRPASSSPSIKIYSDLNNAAYINFVNNSLAATFTVGISTSSYLKFNSAYSSVGINKSPTSNSPPLDVAGGASFTGLVNINASSEFSLTASSGASFGGPVTTTNLSVTGPIRGTGKLTVGTTSGSGELIMPANTGTYDIGSENIYFKDIWASDVHAINNLYGNLIGTADSLTNNRSFNVQGQVTATSVTFNGTSNVIFGTVLTRDAINSQTSTSTVVASHTLMVLDTSTTLTSLQKVSKTDFLSDVYPNLFVTGMITAFGTSTNIPSGFLLCNHSSVSSITYPALYAIIGTSYGSAGAGTFRTPNMTTSTQIAGGSYLTYIIKT